MIGKKINQLATELAPVSTDLTIIGDPTTGVSKKITLAQLGAIFSGAVSFYTNLAGFPAVGDINVIYCAKDTQKLYLWSGSAYVEVFPSQALLDTYQLRSEKGNANGYASLDSQGKVPISQLPSSIMEYKGTWNASTNTPTLANGTGDTGDVYICNVAGTVNFGAGAITFAVGDYVIYSGTIWQRSSGAVGTVTSVAASITGNSVTISGSPVTTSGTLAFAFAGTGAQYIKGDGTLATFPNTIDQAKNLITEVYNSTGATLTKGTVVYINGGQGNLPTVTKAIATGDSTSAQTFGIVQADITNNNNGYVVIAGRLSDLDTQAYTEGTQLYLSATTAGTWTSTKQYAPNHLVYIGVVVRAHPTQGIVEVKIQNGYELDELHNVAAQTPTNNDGLFWESATSLWKNKSIATILGYTPQAQLNGTGFVKASGTTITYDNSTYLTTSAAATTYLPLVLSSTANVVDINGQQFNIWGSAGGFTSGRIIVDPVFSAIGYQNAGVFDGLKILTNGNAEFSNSGITRFFNQVRFDSTLTNGTYTYTLPGATGTLALVSQLTGGTVTSVGLSSATSGVTIGSTPITTSGTITLAIATASGSQQGLLSSTDWTTFNNKQNALTNPVTGTGTTNYLPKFTGTSTIGDSAIVDNTLNVTIAKGNAANDVGLQIQQTANFTAAYINITANNDGGAVYNAIRSNTNGGTTHWQIDGGAAVSNLVIRTGGTERLRINASGNLGLGVSPSAWGSSAIALQIRNGSIWNYNNADNLIIASNNYFDVTNAAYRYVITGFASEYTQDQGKHIWRTAPSGTAGNAISFTQAMTLDANGRLGIGATSMTYALQVNDVAGGNMFRFASGSTVLDYYVSGGNPSFGTASNNDLRFRTNDTTRLTIASTGAATFSSDVTIGAASQLYLTSGDLRYSSNAGFGIVTQNGNRLVSIQNGAFGVTGAATFSSSVTAGGNILVPAGSGLAWSGDASRIMTPEDNVSGALIQTPGIIRFNAGGSEKVRITSGGLVGIGTTSPADILDIYASSGTPAIRLSGAGAGTNTYRITGQLIGVSNTGFGIYDNTNSTYRLVINGSGNVGIGTTSPSYNLTVVGSTSAAAVAAFQNTSSTGYSGAHILNNAGTLIGHFGYGNSGIGSGLSDLVYFGSIASKAVVFTTTDTERMRITSGGELCVGTASTTNGAIINFYKASGTITTISGGTTSAQNHIVFANPNGNVGSIQVSGSATSFNTSSDYRLKTDLKDFSGLDLVSKIKTYDYEWKSDKSRSYGVIAHELQSVINYAVTGVKDGEQMQGVDYSKIVPVLIKAIQEQQQQIEQLKNK